MWKDLLDVLGRLDLVYKEVVPLLKQKKQALIGLKLDELKGIIAKEESLTQKIEQLEKQRLEILNQMAQQNPNINADVKMQDLFSQAPNKIISQRLDLFHKNLSKHIEEVKKISEENNVLATAALDATKFHLNRLSGAKVEPTYGKTGDVTSRRNNYDFNA